MVEPSLDHNRKLKATISGIAVVVLLMRIAFPELRVDAVSLGLLTIAVLPWLSPLIQSAELSGGIKIEFQDVQQAPEKAARRSPSQPQLQPLEPEPSFVAIAEQDPNLALVGLRIEIERRLRALAERHGVPRGRSLTQLIENLRERRTLDSETAAGPRDLIAYGDQAAHGVEVSPAAALSALRLGPAVIQALDARL